MWTAAAVVKNDKTSRPPSIVLTPEAFRRIAGGKRREARHHRFVVATLRTPDGVPDPRLLLGVELWTKFDPRGGATATLAPGSFP